MIKEIVKDIEFLKQKSEDFNFKTDNIYLIQDLLDTAEYHRANCVGLAAPQIGVHKRAIVVLTNTGFEPMLNPVIFWKDLKSKYNTVEGCLSLDGERETKRFRRIKVKYINKYGDTIIRQFDGYQAQIIQHEVDHLNGVLI
jgi:peptide deformylase